MRWLKVQDKEGKFSFRAEKPLKMVRNKHVYEEACEMKLHNENLIRDTIKCVGVLPRLVTSDG